MTGADLNAENEWLIYLLLACLLLSIEGESRLSNAHGVCSLDLSHDGLFRQDIKMLQGGMTIGVFAGGGGAG